MYVSYLELTTFSIVYFARETFYLNNRSKFGPLGSCWIPLIKPVSVRLLNQRTPPLAYLILCHLTSSLVQPSSTRTPLQPRIQDEYLQIAPCRFQFEEISRVHVPVDGRLGKNNVRQRNWVTAC